MNQNQKNILTLIGIGILFFFPFLGSVHLFDWDEINFAESAREMIETGNYFQVQINYEPFWEKPPFFFWMQVISMKLFGINEFAARFPNALIGIISLITLYSIGKKLFSEKFGMIWALIYLASFLPHLYFKSGIIDPIFNFFIFISVYYLAKNLSENTVKDKRKFALISGVFIGLAIITKGPVGLLLLILTLIVFLILKKFKVKMRVQDILIFAISSFSVTFLWFGYETITNSPWFIIEFIQYQIELFTEPVAGHEQPFYYHFLVVLLGCFPMSILALPMFKKLKENTPFDLILWMKILFWVVLILFTIVKTKIVHYSSMSYLPLSFMAAYFIFQLSEKKQIISKSIKIIFLIIGLIFSTLLIITPILFSQKELLSTLIKDDFAVASLNVDMDWQGWEFLIGIIYFVSVIFAFIYLNRGRLMKFVYFVAFSAGATLLLYSIFVVPKIEKFSQGPAIEFYESIEKEDAYITTLGFKSYAHLFYFKLKPDVESDGIATIKENYKKGLANSKDFNMNTLISKTNNWLLHGDIDKKAYFVTKITERNNMKKYQNLTLLKTVGGFDFYYRKP